MRNKEEAHDYRYFPDPDLLPLELTPAEVENLKAHLPELPDEKKTRFARFAAPSLGRAGLGALIWAPYVPGAERSRYERTTGLRVQSIVNIPHPRLGREEPGQGSGAARPERELCVLPGVARLGPGPARDAGRAPHRDSR